ncbi:MAG: hypothetical protein ABJA80_16955 [bacterium]
MRTHSRLAGIAIAALVLGAGSAHAQGKGHDKGNNHGKRDGGEVRTSTGEVVRVRDPRDVTRDRDGRDVLRGRDGREGRYDRGGDERRDGGRRVPPGLAKKPGQMPPGQYKKRYGTNEGADILGGIFRRNGYTVSRVVPNGQSQYVYYRLRDGSERRAIVSPGTDRLRFNNVPTTLLQQVMAALYQ